MFEYFCRDLLRATRREETVGVWSRREYTFTRNHWHLERQVRSMFETLLYWLVVIQWNRKRNLIGYGKKQRSRVRKREKEKLAAHDEAKRGASGTELPSNSAIKLCRQLFASSYLIPPHLAGACTYQVNFSAGKCMHCSWCTELSVSHAPLAWVRRYTFRRSHFRFRRHWGGRFLAFSLTFSDFLNC